MSVVTDSSFSAPRRTNCLSNIWLRNKFKTMLRCDEGDEVRMKGKRSAIEMLRIKKILEKLNDWGWVHRGVPDEGARQHQAPLRQGGQRPQGQYCQGLGPLRQGGQRPHQGQCHVAPWQGGQKRQGHWHSQSSQ